MADSFSRSTRPLLLQVHMVGKVLGVVVATDGTTLKGLIQLSQFNVLCVAGISYLEGNELAVVLGEENVGVVFVISVVVVVLVGVLVVGMVLSRL